MAALLIAILMLTDDGIVTKDELRQYLETTGKERAKREADDRVSNLKRRMDDARKERNPRIRRDAIDKLTRELRAAELAAREPEPALPPLPVHRLAIGAVGIIYAEKEAGGSGDGRPGSQMRVRRIIDRGMAIVSLGYGDRYEADFVLVTRTDGLADGSIIETGDKPYEVTGKGMFSGRTLFEVRAFDLAEFLKRDKAK